MEEVGNGEKQVTSVHEKLVSRIKGYIRQQQHLLAALDYSRESGYQPEAIVKSQLWLESQTWHDHNEERNEEIKEFYFTLERAWDVLAYDRYEIGSKAEHLAGSTLSATYQATHEPVIKLSDPRQGIMLDALADAVGIPHKKGQTEFVIPEKLRSYNKLLMSKEYQERWEKAHANRKK